MNSTHASKEEQELVQAFEADAFKSVLDDARQAQLEAIARHSLKKDTRINIRLSSRDLQALQRRALKEGLPYQSLVSSVLHKYVNGGLKDIASPKPRQPEQS